MDKRRRFGNACEVVAARHLEGQGYKILAHQFRTRYGEIDLVAEKNNELVFVEVKARRNLNFGYPEEAVGKRKFQRMSLAANAFMEKNQLTEQAFRFDLVSIIWPNRCQPEVEHFEAVDIHSEEW